MGLRVPTLTNDFHLDFKDYDYAFPVMNCWKLREPTTLPDLKAHGIDGAPRAMVYVLHVPETLKEGENQVGQAGPGLEVARCLLYR